MSKHLIDWHEECLKNLRHSLARAADAVRAAQNDFNRAQASVLVLEHQIKEARRQGKADFDPEKFCKTKRKNGVLS